MSNAKECGWEDGWENVASTGCLYSSENCRWDFFNLSTVANSLTLPNSKIMHQHYAWFIFRLSVTCNMTYQPPKKKGTNYMSTWFISVKQCVIVHGPLLSCPKRGRGLFTHKRKEEDAELHILPTESHLKAGLTQLHTGIQALTHVGFSGLYKANRGKVWFIKQIKMYNYETKHLKAHRPQLKSRL